METLQVRADAEACEKAALEAENVELRLEVERMQRELEESTRRAELFLHNSGRLEGRVSALSNETQQLKNILDAERAEADSAMAEISQRLDKIDAMRAGYENRIAHLRHALRDVLARLEVCKDYDALRELSLIDLGTSEESGEGEQERKPDRKKVSQGAEIAAPATSDRSDSSADWLMPLP